MDPTEATPRVRAAWAFSRLNQQELAKVSGITYDRLRTILGTGRATDVTLEELRAVADACGVPYAFMEHGWPKEGDPSVHLEELRDDLTALRAQVEDLRLELITQAVAAGVREALSTDESAPGMGAPDRPPK